MLLTSRSWFLDGCAARWSCRMLPLWGPGDGYDFCNFLRVHKYFKIKGLKRKHCMPELKEHNKSHWATLTVFFFLMRKRRLRESFGVRTLLDSSSHPFPGPVDLRVSPRPPPKAAFTPSSPHLPPSSGSDQRMAICVWSLPHSSGHLWASAGCGASGCPWLVPWPHFVFHSIGTFQNP